MPGGLQDIKKRIKSISSTRQVTKAMEAVSASKMRQATGRALTSRDYSALGWQLINNLAKATDSSQHPLLKKSLAPKNILLIFIASDKGLCGGFNSQVIRQMYAFFESQADKNIALIAIGKKGQHILRKLGKNIIGAYEGLSEKPTILNLRPIVQTALTGFISGQYDQVNIIFTDYQSALVQKPISRQLLPLQTMEDVVGATKDRAANSALPPVEYLFEPDTRQLLDAILPRLLEVQIYQAMLESAASEYSARMLAMRQATDSANEMIKGLTLTYNQARQSSITQEIAEISAGRAALED